MTLPLENCTANMEKRHERKKRDEQSMWWISADLNLNQLWYRSKKAFPIIVSIFLAAFTIFIIHMATDWMGYVDMCAVCCFHASIYWNGREWWIFYPQFTPRKLLWWWWWVYRYAVIYPLNEHVKRLNSIWNCNILWMHIWAFTTTLYCISICRGD